jgi:uncharacterized membrane protein YhaH (DUF805 family)
VGTSELSNVLLFSVGFFGLCGVIGFGLLLAPPRLEIGPSGLKQTVLWRTKSFAWTDIYNFRTAIIGLTNKVVGFDYLTPQPKGGVLKRLNTALAGVQGTLQPGWEISPEALATLLNEARGQWLAVEGNSQQIVPVTQSQPIFLAAVSSSRINRKTYWLTTGIIFALALSLSYLPGVQGSGIRLLTTVLFIRIFASRLHDIGRSGWWQLVLYGIQLLTLVLVGRVGGQPLGVAVAAELLIQLIFTVVLGIIPGDTHANRFGSPPNQPSPIAISETFR